ncbi:maleylacetoacetate isomerase [Bowmanella sp. JS7-9]|uniref:maleylacetoacetate isomerase n=1 Tax=Alteromonadaceae TaxID=72275 RepID=UPI00103D24DF|nr:maleylacetoacetate isomerase [Bowmanella sp. JS7-9]TBX25802.1 maleylacetoacetate isomerase [Bowmanella sp. JS7-9]
MALKLYSYWRSSASYRVRIALNIKGLDYTLQPVHLVKDGGQQHSDNYAGLNPANLVPTLVDDDEDVILNQSLAICEYLDEKYPNLPQLLPEHALDRARVRTVAMDIACDVQPLANLRVLNYLASEYGVDQGGKATWAKHWINKCFATVEKRLQNTAADYCFGFTLSLADVCLMPQVYNAHRFGVDMSQFPTIQRIAENLAELEAFKRAAPENQPDAE